MTDVVLRRYTYLPNLLFMLRQQRITLLDPASWEDQNDPYFLTLYRTAKGCRSVLALCFADSVDTFHHWRVFANGPSGVCVQFDKEALIAALSHLPSVRVGNVKYLRLDQLDPGAVTVDDLPFRKRYAYQHESEFRVVFESGLEVLNKLDVNIPLTCIKQINFGPWIHEALFIESKNTINAIAGCGQIRVSRSTLISNSRWRRFGEEVIAGAGGYAIGQNVPEVSRGERQTRERKRKGTASAK
jgi:hypothetical protein